ncbi:hypothetical protein HK100_011497 [Physocladia obscura]|uniref:Uncharacterized protein n=1 Tax=Physocladia obscura TaxID=109957 RepID=A0AAD5XGK5_9FUNG|nr:hypothetical protein HK100_011497 [Physocladia obscura]
MTVEPPTTPISSASITVSAAESKAADNLKRKSPEIEDTPVSALEQSGDGNDDDQTKRSKLESVAASAGPATDNASIYPDTEHFYAWLVTGSEAGAFLASHRLNSVDAALPACKSLVALGVESVYDPTDDDEYEDVDDGDDDAKNLSGKKTAADVSKNNEEKIEDLKETVNFAIEDSCE